jgi:hypothetical protein
MNRLWLVGLCVLPAASHAGAQTAWVVDPKPITTIKGADAAVGQELLQVSGALRLDDGRIVVANGKPVELRIYGSSGAFLTRIGRRGGGPGEFGYNVELISAAGDSIVATTSGNAWKIFRTDGRLAREWTTSAAEMPLIGFYHRAYARPAGVGLTACTKRVIDALPAAPAPGLREVYVVDAGQFWVRPYVDDKRNKWTVYSSGGKLLGTVTVPPGFDLFQVGIDFVVGRTRDDDGQEQIGVYRLSGPRRPRVAATPECAKRIELPPSDFPRERGSDFRSTLRNAETAMEALFSQSKHHARNTDELHLDHIPSGARFDILRSEDNGYVVGVFDLQTTFFCAVGVGISPPGWGDGVIQCGN